MEFTAESVLKKNFLPGSEFVFLQVGAHDGVSYDSLYDFVAEHRSMGVVIEPLKDFYFQLKKNYSYNPAIIPLQKAIHASAPVVTMYRIDPAKAHLLPDWAPGTASINRLHHKKNNVPDEYIIAEEVEAEPLMAVVERYFSAKHPDLVQIDVEGYDLEVLKMIDFSRVKPSLIKVEHMSLSTEDLLEAVRLLRGKGFYTFFDNIDLIAINIHRLRL